MPPKKRTRSHGFFFGPIQLLPDDGDLPTHRDILQAVYYQKNISPSLSNSELSAEILPKLKHKWAQVNPLLKLKPDNSIKVKLKRLLDDAQKIINKRAIKQKLLKNYYEKLDKLFDVAFCQCFIRICDSSCGKTTCVGLHPTDCKCAAAEKIPVMEIKFLHDQRSKVGHRGDIQMQAVDKPEAKRQEKLIARKSREAAALERPGPSSVSHSQSMEVCPELELPPESDGDVEMEDTEFYPDNSYVDPDDSSLQPGRNKRNTVNIESFIAECDRYRISSGAAAALHNALLTDYGLISKEDRSKIVTKSKIRSSRKFHQAVQREKRNVEFAKAGGITCLGFDGKRDRKSKVTEEVEINGEVIEKYLTASQEHISYTSEPGGRYVTHAVIPEHGGTGRGLANTLLDVLAEEKSQETLLALLCDGTAVNTGWKDGCIVHVERDLGEPLVWLICLLHGNELHFRAVFNAADGAGTSGPNSFKGPVGNAVQGPIHLKPVVKFEAIPCADLPDLPAEVVRDLSRDQKILFQYLYAVSTGELTTSVAQQVPGKVDHARWLTLSIRALILYTRTEDPSPSLIRIVLHIVQVYAPMWFIIKCNPKFTNGPKHLFKLMKLVDSIPSQDKEIARKAIQRNAFFADPAVILTAMLESAESAEREFAVKTLTDFRAKPPKKPKLKLLRGIRNAKVPDLNWGATTWTEVIDWNKVKLHQEPRILARLTAEQLEGALVVPLAFPDFPCHSQSVERTVKIVTEVTQQVYGEDNQRDRIESIINCRKSRPAFETKKNYVVQN